MLLKPQPREVDQEYGMPIGNLEWLCLHRLQVVLLLPDRRVLRGAQTE